MRHSSRARHGCEPSLHLGFRHGEIHGFDVPVRTGSDTAASEMRGDQIELGLPIHARAYTASMWFGSVGESVGYE
jgi:hypothetical protein